MWAVVKSNAYGHGIFLFSKLLDSFGVDGFCVDSPIEGIDLRESGIRGSILVLGPTLPVMYAASAASGITVTISSFENLKSLAASRTRPQFHLKIDTGMHRQGFYPGDIKRVIRFLQAHRLTSKWTGVYTHFAAAGDRDDHTFTDRQFEALLGVRDVCTATGYRHLTFHCSATGGVLLDPKYHLDAVRIGDGLYGYMPSRKLETQIDLALRPLLTWRTVLTEVKKLTPGEGIGYDLTETVRRPTLYGVLPVGYWHGLSRSLSGQGLVAVRNKPARILGRIAMDMTAVDLTESGGRVGDVVTLLGPQYSFTDARTMADLTGTISYEVLTRLNPLIERIIV